MTTLLWMTVGYSLTFRDGGGLQAVIGGLDGILVTHVGRRHWVSW